jgi:hypothetical protein
MLKTALFRTPFYPAARATWQAMFNRDHAIHRARMGAF